MSCLEASPAARRVQTTSSARLQRGLPTARVVHAGPVSRFHHGLFPHFEAQVLGPDRGDQIDARLLVMGDRILGGQRLGGEA